MAKALRRFRDWLVALFRRHREGVHYINGADTLPAPLTPQEEEAIFIRLEAGDPSARELLSVHLLRRVV